MSTAAEGGAWGMAVLANYLWNTNEDHSNLADFLDGCVFKDAQSTTEKPVASDVVVSRTSSPASPRACPSSTPPSKPSTSKISKPF